MAIRSKDLDGNVDELGDSELARRAARGDESSFDALYRRHAAAAWRVATAVALNSDDAADAVSEAFTRMLQLLASGRLDSDVPFRPYLLTTTRHAVIDIHRARARLSDDPLASAPEPAATAAGPSEWAELGVDAGLVAEAFRSLPERWRSVLWLTEVEGISTREVGARLGLSANGAAQLAHRARGGLRERYLQAHLRHEPRPQCEQTVAQLGAYTAGALSARATALVDQHLAGCAQCRARADELTDIGGALRTLSLPVPIALAGASLVKYRAAFGLVARHVRKGGVWLMGASEQMTRSLAVTTAVLLALGVITAGLMTGSGGPSPAPGGRVGGSVAIAPATAVSPIPDGSGATTAPVAGGHGLATLVQALSTPSGGDVVLGPATGGVPGATLPTGFGGAGGSPGTGGGSNQPAAGLLQLVLGANLGGTTAAVDLGLLGGCTTLAVDSKPSCGAPPPATSGVQVAVGTPAGQIGPIRGNPTSGSVSPTSNVTTSAAAPTAPAGAPSTPSAGITTVIATVTKAVPKGVVTVGPISATL